MKMKSTHLAVALSAFSLSLFATSVASAQGAKTKVAFVVEVGSEPVPTTPVAPVTAPPAGAEAPVVVAPPAPKAETPTAAPGKEYVWAAGHWQWNPATKSHVWVPGHWERVKHGHVWVHAHWVSYGGKNYFVPGHWRSKGPGDAPPPGAMAPGDDVEEDSDIPPPPPKFENKSVSPGGDHVWVAGHWRWDHKEKAHVWIPGHWEKNREGHHWVPAMWISKNGKHHYVPGHWSKN
jgi:hypothetical protein